MNNDNNKKQLLLRLTKSVWEDLNKWADDDFRSVNGQIEYILAREIAKRKKNNSENNDK